jgi:DNA modification methylase
MRLLHGDCLEVMATLPDNSVDTIVTDPPYGLEFMGKAWDKGVPGVPFWVEMLRIAKPGACLMAMGGTRTYHRLASAIEDAGWRIIDTVAWIYGQGFPKSYDIGKGMDKAQGAEREVVGQHPCPAGRSEAFVQERTDAAAGAFSGSTKYPDGVPITAPATPEAQQWDGWGTALKPAHEPICVAYKPRDGTYVENALKWGVAGLWIDGGRVGTDGGTTKGNPPKDKSNGIYGDGINGACDIVDIGKGRFPANVIHDGSDEVLRGFPECKQAKDVSEFRQLESMRFSAGGQGVKPQRQTNGEIITASAARFFYCAKASRSERNAGLEGMPEKERADLNKMMGNDNGGKSMKTGSGNDRNNRLQNHHPTVKPIALMEYLVRLTRTPTGGVVLDPFMGSGTTGIACVNEGRDFIGIEQSEEYLEIARRRIEYAESNKTPEQPVLFGNNGHK